jgi:glycosyltransferase involved in cell wall biosynthesis
VRICLIYDCLYPYTVGGAERWYRHLAERQASRGNQVTYLTLRQWRDREEPQIEGVRVVAVGPPFELYHAGRRRIWPALRFGLGVCRHLLVEGRRYDVVHTGWSPFFSVLAAAAVRRVHRYRLFVDWIEVWTRAYWLEYLGAVGGRIGWRVQRLCLRIRHRAFCFSQLHARRLRAEGFEGEMTVLEGMYAGGLAPREPTPGEPVVVFAGRHIPEKRVPEIVEAIAHARRQLPELRAEIYGDGPTRTDVLRAISDHRLDGIVDAPGFVESERVAAAIGRALCLLLPSRREGYGLVVVEAAARGTPSIVVEGPDNPAVELIEEGVNGVVAQSAAPEELASAIVRVWNGGQELRESTSSWFARNARRLSLDQSLESVLEAYARAA